MDEALKDPKKDPPVAAMSPNATEAALRVVQSLFFRASRIPAIAPDRIFCVGAPPTWSRDWKAPCFLNLRVHRKNKDICTIKPNVKKKSLNGSKEVRENIGGIQNRLTDSLIAYAK